MPRSATCAIELIRIAAPAIGGTLAAVALHCQPDVVGTQAGPRDTKLSGKPGNCAAFPNREMQGVIGRRMRGAVDPTLIRPKILARVSMIRSWRSHRGAPGICGALIGIGTHRKKPAAPSGLC